MGHVERDRIPSDLVWVAERLEQERPEATPLELDQIKLRVKTRAGRSSRSRLKGNPLKSRLAITAILVLGLVFSSGGATLALSGSSGSGSAAGVQYPNSVPPTKTQGETPVLGEEQGGGNEAVLGAEQGSSPGSTAQATRQVAATESKNELPFTGLAALPLIVLGLAMLGGGGVLYRSARCERTE
jgi:hypothetical protein